MQYRWVFQSTPKLALNSISNYLICSDWDLYRLFLNDAEGVQGRALPQAPPLSKAGVWGGM